jgi:hypothetical protein
LSFSDSVINLLNEDCKWINSGKLKTGHDGRGVPDEPVIVVDFQGMLDHAKAKEVFNGHGLGREGIDLPPNK